MSEDRSPRPIPTKSMRQEVLAEFAKRNIEFEPIPKDNLPFRGLFLGIDEKIPGKWGDTNRYRFECPESKIEYSLLSTSDSLMKIVNKFNLYNCMCLVDQDENGWWRIYPD